MIKYVDKIFNDFPEQVITTVPPSTPAANHLFDISGDDDPLKHPLSEEQSGHSIVPLLNYFSYVCGHVEIFKQLSHSSRLVFVLLMMMTGTSSYVY